MADELYHHGIKGQVHGVRNGPPYPLSRKVSTGKRLIKKMSNATAELKKKRTEHAEEKKKRSDLKKSKESERKRDPKSMTDEELRKAIDRMDLELRFKQKYNALNPQKVSRGKKMMNNLANDASSIFHESLKDAGKKAVTKMMNDAFNKAYSKASESSKGDKKKKEEKKDRPNKTTNITFNIGGGNKKDKPKAESKPKPDPNKK